MKKSHCKSLRVPKSCCYIVFKVGKIAHSEELEHDTIRGETIIIDYDQFNRVVGIELIAPKLKRCQRA